MGNRNQCEKRSSRFRRRCLVGVLGLATWAFASTVCTESISHAQVIDQKIETKKAVDEIDPMIGTITKRNEADFYGLGKTFPGATTPFGMVQLSPDTITGGDNASGYNYLHDSIEGFSLCHLSGTGWYGEMGNFLAMPTTGPLEVNRDQARSTFNHDNERASAGYYSVQLDRYDVTAELTATRRAGMYRFTFPRSDSARIQVDLARRIGMKSRWLENSRQRVEFVDNQTVRGWMDCPHTDGGWGQGAGKVSYRLYFFARLSEPCLRKGIWDKHDVAAGVSKYEGANTGFFVEFRTNKREQVTMKVGISLVDLDGAQNNLDAEIAGWDFDKIHQLARQQWQNALSAVEYQGGSAKDRTVMATSLYHSFMEPRSIVDVDGRYRGADDTIRKSDRFQYRTVFSGWDAFRSHFPLLTIVRPDVIHDEINSWIELADTTDRDYLPRWEMLHSYSGCMLGNPAVSVVLDAYAKGIRSFDVTRAYVLCKNSVHRFGNQPHGYTPDSLSHTVEYAYSDWCVGRFAELLGRTDESEEYYHRSLAYANIWDPSVKWMRAKNVAGDWLAWSKKTDYGQGCVESNPYQQAWFVPHDIQGLMDLMNEDPGTAEDFFTSELVGFFEQAPEDLAWNDFYNHPNEPCHHVAFLFNYVGKPWLTQKWTRKICDVAYGLGPYGLGGNEDLGQMSAWYVLAAAGLYPVCPGDGIYQLTSPVFDEVTFKLDQRYASGSTFRIVAHHNSPENIYIQSAKLNNQQLDRAWIAHNEIASGGILEFEMGPRPNRTWGAPPPLSNVPKTIKQHLSPDRVE